MLLIFVKLFVCFLAEFIIHLSEKNNTLDTFKKSLIDNGAEFSDSFMSNLLRIIQHMKPQKRKISAITEDTVESNREKNKSKEGIVKSTYRISTEEDRYSCQAVEKKIESNKEKLDDCPVPGKVVFYFLCLAIKVKVITLIQDMALVVL